MTSNPTAPKEKTGLHPRNRHRFGYDFELLTQCHPELAQFVKPNPLGIPSIHFADPAAVKALNLALLKQHYGIVSWDIPEGFLCPPIPGRADYIHYVADLLGGLTGPEVNVLDIGVGANCVYPIIGCHEYGWSFVGSDIDPLVIQNAQRIVDSNPSLRVQLRQQTVSNQIFKDVIQPGEVFDVSISNPPFHSSIAAATAGTRRKLRNLSGKSAPETILNFGGKDTDLSCEGGEFGFIRRMITESIAIPKTCRWFTTLVSKSSNLPGLYKALKAANAIEVKTIEMGQGQKLSRIVAWTFLNAEQHKNWRRG